jgi:hypothetical protein
MDHKSKIYVFEAPVSYGSYVKRIYMTMPCPYTFM